MKYTSAAALMLAALSGCDIGSMTLDISGFDTFEYKSGAVWVVPAIGSAVIRRTDDGAYAATFVAYAECINGELQSTHELQPGTVEHVLTADEAAAMAAVFASVTLQFYFVPWFYFDVPVHTFCWDFVCAQDLEQFPGGVSISSATAFEIRELLEAMLAAELCENGGT